jgi:signal peptidase I
MREEAMRASTQPAQETEQAAKCKLAEAVLRRFGMLRLKVTGRSMLPSVWPGDILLIHRRDIRQVILGNIVLFSRKGQLIAHRVIATLDTAEDPALVTQGDSLSSPDVPVTSAELLGKVAFVFHCGAWREPQARLGLGARLGAAFLSHCSLAARVLVRLQMSRQYPERREEIGAR